MRASAGYCGEPTGCSLHDYYAILGLDPDASPESVKIAYRRLARQHHPDLKAHCSTEVEKASVDACMAQLNEAYAVLSNAKSRMEYDERLHLECILVSKTATRSASERETAADQTKTATNKAHHSRIRPRHELDSTVVTQFSGHLRETFLSKRSGFSWNAVEFEGFDWGLEALSWSSHYCVALRCFAAVDSSTTKKFINYSEMVIERWKRHIRKNYFLFLLPFLQMSEWESVSSQVQPFVGGKTRAALSIPPTGVILLDMHHGRILRLGSPFPDKRFEQLIRSIRTAA